MRIAYGGIHTECSTYSHLCQTGADFSVLHGTDMARDLGLNVPSGVEMLPLFHARSIPGGPVEFATYQALKTRFLTLLEDALPLDGVYLALHGAIHVVGLHDAEGDWISAVRRLVGPDMPIAVSYDLHGNVTQQIIDEIDIFSAYRTAPHIDTAQTRNRALALLVDRIQNATPYAVGWVPVPVLWPGERTSTEDHPARGLYARLPGLDRQNGIADSNLMVGYVWADTRRASAASVVTGTDRDAIARVACDIAQSYWNARADFGFGVQTAPLERCLDRVCATTTTPVVLADSGDNPTGGGVGDRADVLQAVLARGIAGAVFAAIADAPAAKAVARAGVGATLTLNIGGSLGSPGARVSCRATVITIQGSEMGGDLEAVVQVAGNTVVLTQQRRPYHDLADFHRLGLDPHRARVIVVKSGYLSPDLAPLANPALMALTDGAVNQDIGALENRERKNPTYPFQTGFDWAPDCRFSRRAG